MKKIICVLGILVVILMTTCGLLLGQLNSAEYKAECADKVIEQFIEDNEDYFLDVLCEGDAWINYSECLDK